MPRGSVRSEEMQSGADVQKGSNADGVTIGWSEEVRGRSCQGVRTHLRGQGESP